MTTRGIPQDEILSPFKLAMAAGQIAGFFGLYIIGAAIHSFEQRTVGLRRSINELRSSWRRARERGVVWTGEEDP